MKPPNVLVFNSGGITAFEAIQRSLRFCLNTDCYTIYKTNEDQILSLPWQKHTGLMIVSNLDASLIANQVQRKLQEFVQDGGSLLVFGALFRNGVFNTIYTPLTTSTTLTRINMDLRCALSSKVAYSPQVGATSLLKDETGNDVIVRLGNVILSQVHLEYDASDLENLSQDDFNSLKMVNVSRLELLRNILSEQFHLNVTWASSDLRPTLCHLFAKSPEVRAVAIQRMENDIKNVPSFQIVESAELFKKDAKYCQVLRPQSSTDAKVDFDFDYYFNVLKTSKLGRVVMYSEITTTTMEMIKCLSSYHGAVAMATRQLEGRGRTCNRWLSPPGCLMFTLCLRIGDSSASPDNICSFPPSRLSLLQHLVAMGIVRAIRAQPGHENLNLRIKWPNDLYIGEEAKVGGVLCTTIMNPDRSFTCYIGCALNMSNSQPTLCINDITRQNWRESGASGNNVLLTREVALAAILKNVEDILDDVTESSVVQGVLSEYYRYWLHSYQDVTIQMPDRSGSGTTSVSGRIVHLDDYGHLVAEIGDEKRKLILRADGTSFDLMDKLLIMKDLN